MAMYVDVECGVYFDSFGRPVFKDFLNSNCNRWIFNDRQLQSICSRFCDHYCVYYCILRSSGIDLRKISRSLTNDTGFNDVLVHGFIRQ